MLKIVTAALVALVLLIFGFVWFSGKSPTLKFVQPVTAVGSATQVSVEVQDPHGIKSFAAQLEQDGQTQVLMADKKATPEPVRIYGFLAGKKQAAFLKEGSATLVVTAKSNDFRGATQDLTQKVQVILRPPTIVADGRQHYINQGGAELVTLDLGGNWTDAGVHSGKYTAGTFALPVSRKTAITGSPSSRIHGICLRTSSP